MKNYVEKIIKTFLILKKIPKLYRHGKWLLLIVLLGTCEVFSNALIEPPIFKRLISCLFL